MKALRYGAWVAVVGNRRSCAGSIGERQAEQGRSDRERLIGAWHLVHIDSPGPDGKPAISLSRKAC